MIVRGGSLCRVVANRRNAKKSTGPRSVRGKATSRMNALVHGLNKPAVAEDIQNDMGEFIANILASSDLTRSMAMDFATEIWILGRVRRARNHALSRIEKALEGDMPALSDALSAFLRLDGYERKARSRLSRRMHEIDNVCGLGRRLAKRTHHVSRKIKYL